MPTYAQRADLATYIVGWAPSVDTDADDALIERAERDIDVLLGPIPIDPASTTGLKLDPAKLLPWEADALTRTVCAQVEHRVAVGEANIGQPIAKTVKGPEFEKQLAVSDGAKIPEYGPRVTVELAAISHLRQLAARGAP